MMMYHYALCVLPNAALLMAKMNGDDDETAASPIIFGEREAAAINRQ